MDNLCCSNSRLNNHANTCGNQKIVSAARILGSGDDRVTLSENELFRLLTQCRNDLSIPHSVSKLPPVSPPSADYYRIPMSWFETVQKNCPSAPALVERLSACVAYTADFRLYFENLATLHKRRLKYQRILGSSGKFVPRDVVHWDPGT
jgi:hypothetical protein